MSFVLQRKKGALVGRRLHKAMGELLLLLMIDGAVFFGRNPLNAAKCDWCSTVPPCQEMKKEELVYRWD